jgi:hypothetical protein
MAPEPGLEPNSFLPPRREEMLQFAFGIEQRLR